MSDFVRSLGGNEAAAVGKLHYDILTAEDASLAEKLLEGSSEEVIPEITCSCHFLPATVSTMERSSTCVLHSRPGP